MRTQWGSATDRGAVREVNEDALLAHPPVFLVADGMGGHDAGDVASRIAVEEFADLAGRGATPDDVHACFLRAAHRIRTEFTGGRQGGTTVAGVVLTHDGGRPLWLVLNVGDSRVYRVTADGLVQVSVDHSVVGELVAAGGLDAAGARTHPDRHVLTRVLGSTEVVEPDYWLLPAAEGDRLLVCSDGLTRELHDEDVAALLAHPDPQAAAAALVDAAVGRGARDNVTTVVVDAVPAGRTATGVLVGSVGAARAGTGPVVGPAGPGVPPADGWDDARDGVTVPRTPRPRPSLEPGAVARPDVVPSSPPVPTVPPVPPPGGAA
ncbi:PP2C family protein-serine/threonine phosphatase [Cellulomonas marina]|uniref:Protein phosphatase n=1 Tax=Cellulomonas marina TaxID=988821 RepID=A0A1I0YV15_9CELL|nr:protein phosphatase 2C domain-containing protein [Cellulomonas marina]GIG27532.1 hypothetical protein Cma02nite_01320 [Cellulomonas marina]SFB16250.1 protein phosphatase [Cellulomonas marina]